MQALSAPHGRCGVHRRAQLRDMTRQTLQAAGAPGRAQAGRGARAAVTVRAGLLDMLSSVGKKETASSQPAGSGEPFGTLGISISLGGRDQQEDACTAVESKQGYIFAGVYDGHMGSTCSTFLRENMLPTLERIISKDKALVEACKGDGSGSTPLMFGPVLEQLFQTTDDMVIKHLATGKDVPQEERNSGTTATVLMVWPKKLVVANCGDTRAVLAGRNNSAIDLTADHRPFGSSPVVRKEMARVKEAGGWILDGRVLGLLAVSRALGDPDFKDGRQQLLKDGVRDGWWSQEFADSVKFKSAPVISVPDCSEVELRPEHEFVVVASDGLWDVVSSSQAVAFVRGELRAGRTVQEAAAALSKHAAVTRKSTDNVSVVIVKLR